MGYAFAAHKLFSCKLEDIVCAHYYPITNNFVTIKYTGSQIAKYLENLINEVWIIRKLKKTEFCAEQNQFCNWCGYKPYCPLFEDGTIVERRVQEAKKKKKEKRG
jgi:hypothetical protein